MYCISQNPNFTSATRPIPNNIFFLDDFKLLVNRAISRTEIHKRFKPRLYTYADYIIVKFYALNSDMSVEWASERLNKYFFSRLRKRMKLKRKIFSDGIRQRRLIPHQTEVDKFFRLLTKAEVHTIFGNILTELNLRIKRDDFGSSKMRFLADNTKYAYYGKKITSHEIGTMGMPGTRYCRMIQGHALNGCGMTLFTDFYAVEKGKYRAAPLAPSVDWLK